jgi:hypothetical protein
MNLLEKNGLHASIAGAAVLLSLSGCSQYTRTTPAVVKQAIVDAAVLGKTPDDAIQRLRSIRLPVVDSLVVGRYLADRRVVETTVVDARKTWFSKWSVNAIVSFDSTHHATGLDVYYSAHSPL